MFILKYGASKGVRPGLMLIMPNIVGYRVSWPVNYNIPIEERKKERTERYSGRDMNLNYIYFFFNWNFGLYTNKATTCHLNNFSIRPTCFCHTIGAWKPLVI